MVDGHEAVLRGGMHGVAAGRSGVSVSGSMMPCRVSWCAVSGTGGGMNGETGGGGMHGEMRSEGMAVPFLSARFVRSRVAISQRGAFGKFSAFFTMR